MSEVLRWFFCRGTFVGDLVNREFLFSFAELTDVKNFVATDFQFLGYFEFSNQSQRAPN